MGYLFAGEEGRAEMRKLDANIARLPGMEGLTLFQDVIGQAEPQEQEAAAADEAGSARRQVA